MPVYFRYYEKSTDDVCKETADSANEKGSTDEVGKEQVDSASVEEYRNKVVDVNNSPMKLRRRSKVKKMFPEFIMDSPPYDDDDEDLTLAIFLSEETQQHEVTDTNGKKEN